MKLVLLSILFCVAVYATSATKLLASSSRTLNRRETKLVRRLFKRQAYDPNCQRDRCPTPNCGKDFISATLPGECCERCIPWEYAQAIGLVPRGPQAVQDNRQPPQRQPEPYNPYQYNQQPQQPAQHVDVYIYGPDDGARVSSGQDIYFDCEVVSPYNQYAQPRWSRSGNQPLPYNAQTTVLPGNRKLARLTITGATHGDAGRYECSAGTGNSNDQTSIDLQVSDGGYYPRPQPQPQPQPHPQYPQYDPYQPPYYPPQPQPEPQPHPHPHPQPQPQPQPQPNADDEDDAAEDDENGDDDQEPPAPATQPPAPVTQPPAPAPSQGEDNAEEDEPEYPEDYTENE